MIATNEQITDLANRLGIARQSALFILIAIDFSLKSKQFTTEYGTFGHDELETALAQLRNENWDITTGRKK